MENSLLAKQMLNCLFHHIDWQKI